MPFKSEAQRKYLWANEPGIAREWTDKHGSRIHKAGGGIGQLVNQDQEDQGMVEFLIGNLDHLKIHMQ